MIVVPSLDFLLHRLFGHSIDIPKTVNHAFGRQHGPPGKNRVALTHGLNILGNQLFHIAACDFLHARADALSGRLDNVLVAHGRQLVKMGLSDV